MLKYLLDSLDGLDEATAKLYESVTGGKFQLKVEGLPKSEDTSGLKSALQKERTTVAKQDGDLKAWLKLGETPDVVSTTIADLKKAKGTPSDSEKLLEQALEQAKVQHKTMLEKVTTERDVALASEHTAIVTSGFTSALAKAGFSDTGLDMLPKLHSGRVKMVERNGSRLAEIMTADGSPMVGTGDGSRATFDDLAKEFATSYPDLVKSDRKAGAGTVPGAGGAGNEKTMLRADWDKIADPVAQQKIVADGVKLVDGP